MTQYSAVIDREDFDSDLSGVPTVVRVVVCDDHPISAQAIAGWLEADPLMELVGSASSFDELLVLHRRHHPDVVVMDLSLPDVDGIEATSRLLAEDPTARVVVFSAHVERRLVLEALKAGACGYIPKGTSGARLVEGLRAASAGEPALVGEAASVLVAMGRGDVHEEDLTPRQIDVLRAAAAGMTRREIADHLHISVGTVRSHLEAVYVRLGVHNATGAIAEGRARGILL